MSTADLAFHLSIRDVPEEGVSVLQIKDAFLNYASSEDLKTNLKEQCRARLAHGVRRFAIDLSRVNVMDSCGLSVLISMKKLVESENAHMSLFGLSPMIRRLLEITKLDTVFDVRPDEQSCVAALACDAAIS
jgi:anti-sigma B factor antagonist